MFTLRPRLQCAILVLACLVSDGVWPRAQEPTSPIVADAPTSDATDLRKEIDELKAQNKAMTARIAQLAQKPPSIEEVKQGYKEGFTKAKADAKTDANTKAGCDASGGTQMLLSNKAGTIELYCAVTVR